ISRRLVSTSSIVALGGIDIAAGSTGSSRSATNSRMETVSRMGTDTSMRRPSRSRMVVTPGSRPAHGLRKHPAVGVFCHRQVLLPRDGLYSLQQWYLGAGLYRLL